MLFQFYSRTDRRATEDISTMAAQVRAGSVESIAVAQDQVNLTVRLKSGEELISRKERTSSVPDTLKTLGVPEDKLAAVRISVEDASMWGNVLTIATGLLPLLVFGGFIFFMLRQAQGGTNQAFSFGKSKARLWTSDKPTVTFADVAGVEEAKQELTEVVEFLKEPQKFIALGARIPKGVLMVGPPGCGKTLMARAIAGEAGVPFFSISGSEFVEMFVGVGASRVRDLFEQAKKHSPCIVFIDEIDAVGRHRGAGLGGSHDEREQTLNQMLVEMDGFDTDTNVIIVAATNRPDILDPALLRPGRFDRQVVIDRPDMRGRLEILKIHARGKPLAEDVNLEAVAKLSIGFSGADIENLVNESAILAARRNRKSISRQDFIHSFEKIVAGPERRSRSKSREELEIVAYHEAGHALVAHLLPHCDPVYKVTVISRGMAGGYTMPLPREDTSFMYKDKLEEDLAFMLGGRAAEEIIFGDITTGASNDLERTTKIARSMVTQYGMSDRLGPLTFGVKEELIFLGRDIGEQRNYSEEVAREIDREVRGIITRAHEKATELLTSQKHVLIIIAERLMEIETLDQEDFENLVGTPKAVEIAA
ncbi:MAG: ATP-dependent zinc metalloprotease FtsH [Chloroflexi bacterium]|nr:ATP-dependent zinc metalloprotease FtsH [Chloroflexota bacterium]